MTRPTSVLLLLLAGCGGGSSGNDAPRDVGPGIEGLRFPDVPARFDRAPDAPRPAEATIADRAREQSDDVPHDLRASERSRDLPRADLWLTDLPKPDLWKGGPCFYDWANWTCQTSGSTSTAGCGIATLTCTTVWITTICTCTVSGTSKQCPQVGGSGCTRCQNAFKSGCCVPP